MASIEFERTFANSIGGATTMDDDPGDDAAPTIMNMSLKQLIRNIARTWNEMYVDMVDGRRFEVIFDPYRRAYVGITVSVVSILLIILINGDRR